MRLLFLLLVAANLALYAWFQHFSPADGVADPEPARRQLHPEKIRVLRERAPPVPVAAAAMPAAAPAPDTAPAASPAACSEWGGFALAEAPRAEQALASLSLGARLSQRRSEETAGWWVFIPPQGNRAGALKKTAELKSLGVDDYFVLQEEGKWRWAVSLGIFSSEDAAKSRLDSLKSRGVRSAQTGERDTAVAKVWFQMRNADAPLQAKLREIALGFPGTEVRTCP